MEKVKKILFPTDFSEHAENAFRYTLLLADQLEARVEVLHVVYPQGESIDLPVMVAQANEIKVEAARKKITTFIENGFTQVVQKVKQLPDVSKVIEIGAPVYTIQNFAERNDIDIIVMGTQGENSTINKILGSISGAVVKKAECGVIVVPKDVSFEKINNIAYASDLMDEDPYEIWKALRLLKPISPILHFVHFNLKKDGVEATEKMENMRKYIEERLPALQSKTYYLPANDLSEALNDFVDDHAIDLVVMFQPHRSFLDNLLHRSRTKKMTAQTKAPLMVVK